MDENRKPARKPRTATAAKPAAKTAPTKTTPAKALAKPAAKVRNKVTQRIALQKRRCSTCPPVPGIGRGGGEIQRNRRSFPGSDDLFRNG